MTAPEAALPGPLRRPFAAREAQLLSVLVVDDDELTADLMAVAVQSFGHRCRVAADGEAALRAMVEEAPDVVISDLEMPGISGTELCRRVREAAPDVSRIYFILLSGYDDQAHLEAGAAAGADDYQVKPVDLDKLQASLLVAKDIGRRTRC